jgi:hypothetical protein
MKKPTLTLFRNIDFRLLAVAVVLVTTGSRFSVIGLAAARV